MRFFDWIVYFPQIKNIFLIIPEMQQQTITVIIQKKLKINNMLRQFLSVRHRNESDQMNIYEAIHHRSKSSLQRIQKHKLLGKKIMTINDRVERIKNKYASYGNLQQRFLQCHSQQLTSNSNVTNKENQSTFINTSVNLNLNRINNERKFNEELKVPETQLASKKKKKIKEWHKIHELQEINMKISMLIQSLKNEEKQSLQSQNQHKHHIQVQTFQPAQIVANNITNQYQNFNELQKTGPNIIDFSSLNLTKFTNAQSKRSRIKTQQSINTSKRSNKSFKKNPKSENEGQNSKSKSKSKSKRQNGKLTQPQPNSSSLKKSQKQLHNSLILLQENKQIRFIKAFIRQIQLDQKFFKNKTKLVKSGKSIKPLLRNAVQKTQLSKQQKQIVLEFNFQDIDPLFTERNSLSKINEKPDQNKLVYSVIDSFLTCQDHWKRKIYKKFDKKQINLSDLDIEDKGYFLKQDFTRFLSLKTRKMYYNRQINLIFRRINQRRSKIVSINQLINCLCI